MILLDTNIISEFIKTSPDRNLLAWLDFHAKPDFYLCAPVIAELRFGVALLPEGMRRNALHDACDRVENETFAGRILMFDRMAAYRYAELRARRKKDGKPLAVMDAVIAAIASAHAMTLATRNIKDFQGLDIPLVDPFAAR